MKELFILSAQRSGSNWLHRCLDVHDEIRINGEIHPSAVLCMLENVRAGDDVCYQSLLNNDVYRDAGISYVQKLMDYYAPDKPAAKILADKTAVPCLRSLRKYPEQMNYLSVLQKNFPQAKKILIVRDVRDVIVSHSEWHKQKYGHILKGTPIAFYYFLRHVNNWCLLYERWLDEALQDENTIVLHYEMMKSQFPEEIRRIYDFLEIEVNDEFIQMIIDKFYSIDSSYYAKENEARGYAFFRKGAVGEWKQKFKWYHQAVINLFYSGRVDAINKKARQEV